ncbi:low molecular weight phosphotyrosine protein phosphatase [Aestuariimicrobium sp. p3-SID1156]|uniref:low molecular weight protein-tyrosine-phosphatase n=1 Tax=Aestuariimicrobium sp. p3-SID1156 TaxID=2916038 RepID=UPI00223B7D02|nr:low molecular weight protein-tyrosine-phosphatase [Aestuariimicrobium sp. p3-SID1156]MCT1458147.1 low molecular weight phosphotyrosine protein phosphatase [Aestuariimicrobium sp. p3-SID1156]
MTRPHVMFLCWGNICRSPMAEVVARAAADREGVDAEFSSTGVSAEESGNPIDSRAAKVLGAHGYDVHDHHARQLTATLLEDVDLIVAAEQYHLDRLAALGVDVPRTALMTDFDPESVPGSPLPDPWYGDMTDFEDTLAVLERAMPALLNDLAESSA